MTESAKTDLTGDEAMVVQDAWSDICNLPVTPGSIQVKDKVHFLNVADTCVNKKNANLADTEIKETEDKFAHSYLPCHNHEKKIEVIRKKRLTEPTLHHIFWLLCTHPESFRNRHFSTPRASMWPLNSF